MRARKRQSAKPRVQPKVGPRGELRVKSEAVGPAITLRIEELGTRGDGVAVIGGLSHFVPGAMPGDLVSARCEKEGRFGKQMQLEALLEASPDRRQPPCQHFEPCGGCQLQFLPGDQYAAFVKKRITEALAQQGLDFDQILPPHISPAGSRRRLGLKLQRKGGRVQMGFFERGSHALVDVAHCPVSEPMLANLFGPLRTLFTPWHRLPSDVFLTLSAAGVDLDIASADPITPDIQADLQAFAEAEDIARIVWREPDLSYAVSERRQPYMLYGGCPVSLPHRAFIQATANGEAALVDRVCRMVGSASRIADLFAGLGTFSLPLAGKNARVHAVEGDRAAVSALARAAGSKLTTEHRDLFRNPLSPAELAPYDAVVFDPPRTGAASQVVMLAKSPVPCVVAVSCNPNTFARDAKTLIEGGYRLQSLLPVGQFLWSSHVELVACFRR